MAHVYRLVNGRYYAVMGYNDGHEILRIMPETWKPGESDTVYDEAGQRVERK